MSKFNDLERLKKVCKNLDNIFGLIYHMDKNEYKRMRGFIDSRYEVSMPYNYPESTN